MPNSIAKPLLFPFVAILLYNVDNMYKNTSDYCTIIILLCRILTMFACLPFLLTRIPLRLIPPTALALTACSPTGHELPSELSAPTWTTPDITGQNALDRGEREGKQEVVTHSLHLEGARKEESSQTGWDQEGGVRVHQYQVVSSIEAGHTGEYGVRGCRWWCSLRRPCDNPCGEYQCLRNGHEMYQWV